MGAPPDRLPRRFCWPYERLPEAVGEAILRADLPTVASGVDPIRRETETENGYLTRWLRHAVRGMGLEGVPAPVPGHALEDALMEPGAYLILAGAERNGSFRAASVVSGSGGRCVVALPEGGEWHGSCDDLCDAMRAETSGSTSVERLFDDLPGGHAALARLVAREGLGSVTFTVVRYELDAAHPLVSTLRRAGALGRVAAYAAVAALQGLTATLAALTLGNAAVTGLVDLGRIVAWSVLAASNVPLQYVASRLVGQLSLDLGGALKRRLLEGALFIEQDEVRREGFGRMLARLNEASVVEQTSIADLIGVFAPGFQLVAAYVLFAKGAAPGALLGLLALFTAGALALGVAFYRRYRASYDARVGLTEDLVDKIVGHRTRAVQAHASRLHEDEDVALHAYAERSAALNAHAAATVVYGRAWLFAAGVALLVAFAFGAPLGALLASAVAIYLASASLSSLLAFASSLTTWLCAWQGIRPLFVAGRERARPSRAAEEARTDGIDTVVSSLGFAYGQGARPILANANLRIRVGDRVLLGGPSGGGKTTLSKLLTGELRPSSGTILVDGVDYFSVSDTEWRRRIGSSPQFHENYLFSHTFGFNVDPNALDGELSAEAFAVCQELGLTDVLSKMPSGPAQILGETGWQLSHGERSRVFIARSLLQGADLLIFDESFGALDPESLAKALVCVRKRARTLLVIAHE